MRWIGSQLVVEATGKLDGVMVYGVPIDGVMPLWTRAGFERSGVAKDVNGWAATQRVGSLG